MGYFASLSAVILIHASTALAQGESKDPDGRLVPTASQNATGKQAPTGKPDTVEQRGPTARKADDSDSVRVTPVELRSESNPGFVEYRVAVTVRSAKGGGREHTAYLAEEDVDWVINGLDRFARVRDKPTMKGTVSQLDTQARLSFSLFDLPSGELGLSVSAGEAPRVAAYMDSGAIEKIQGMLVRAKGSIAKARAASR